MRKFLNRLLDVHSNVSGSVEHLSEQRFNNYGRLGFVTIKDDVTGVKCSFHWGY